MGLYISFDGGSGVGKGTLIAAFKQYLQSLGYNVAVIKDNEMDPLRDLGAQMLPWCVEQKLNRNAFLFPLFAAGYQLSERPLAMALGRHDIVIRDRSFISSLGYVPATSKFTQEDVWDLYVRHLKLQVPDIVVIVDADIEIAEERIKSRRQEDIGLGGKMTADRAHREAIRREFLKVPQNFRARLNAVIVHNNGTAAEGHERNASIDAGVATIVNYCQSRGLLK